MPSAAHRHRTKLPRAMLLCIGLAGIIAIVAAQLMTSRPRTPLPRSQRAALTADGAGMARNIERPAAPAPASTTTTTAATATTSTSTSTTTTTTTPVVPPTTPAPTAAPPAVTTAPAPAETSAVPAVGRATAWGCAAAVAYLEAYAAKGFTFACPGDAEGHDAMTCLAEQGACPSSAVIAIADPCPAAYMNEASNSWVLLGASDAPIDPYGACPS